MISRRSFLQSSLFSALAAPLVAKTPGLLMPVKALASEPELLPPGHYTCTMQYIQYGPGGFVEWHEVGTGRLICRTHVQDLIPSQQEFLRYGDT